MLLAACLLPHSSVPPPRTSAPAPALARPVAPWSPVQLLTGGTVRQRPSPGPVYAIDYPLAPEQPFPAALLSTLRAIAFVKEHCGCDEVDLLGDSAGGNLATMAAALLANPGLMQAFVQECGGQPGGEPRPGWDGDTASWLRTAWAEDVTEGGIVAVKREARRRRQKKEQARKAAAAKASPSEPTPEVTLP